MEYVMSKVMFNSIVKEIRKNNNKKGNPKDMVISYLNETAGIKGEIVDIIIKG